MFDFSYANILHSNVINFAIMIAFFGAVIYFLKVPKKLEDYRSSIQKTVEDSDSLKEEAKKEFEKVSDSLKNINDELDEIVKRAEETAKAFEIKARQDLDKTVETIKRNIEKQVHSEENHVQAELLKNVSSSSIEVAQRQIKSALDKDKELHKRYINDFINSLDKLDV